MSPDFGSCAMTAHPYQIVFILPKKVSASSDTTDVSPDMAARHHDTNNNNRNGILSLLLSVIMLVKPSLASAQANQPQGLVKEPQKVEAPRKDIPQASEAQDTVVTSESPYLRAVREFADNVIEHGRDTYGPKHTPLFVDGLNVNTHEPVEWIASNGDRWILSNLASQQNLFRTLDGLTTITGDPKYRQAAMEAIEYAFENLRTPNGLLYWGIGVAYDAQGDRIALPYGSGGQSLKWHLPYYELMWEVNPDATKQFIEAYWSILILDWSNLDMNRSGPIDRLLNQPWKHKYTGGPVYFEATADGKAFISAGSDLSRAAALLYSLSGDREPLVWSKRLIHRYVETRHPEVGISGSPYNRSRDDKTQYQFRNDFMGHFVLQGTFFPQDYVGWSNPMVRELSLGYLNVAPGIPYSIISGPCWMSQLILGDMLGQDGAEFTQWALEELTAIGKRAYRKNDNSFIPMLIDGTSIEGYVCKRDGHYGAKGTTFNAIPAVPMDFWAYALAYRITEDEFMWEMAHNIAQGLDLGNIGFSPTAKAEMNNNTNCCDPFALLAFLELYKKTQNKTFLQMSHRIGANILASRFHKGFFIASNKHIYAKFDAFEPLALLHLYTVAEAGRQSIPEIWPNKSMLNGPYRDRYFATDYEVIYCLTESLYPPRTLEEAAAAGDLEEVKSLISQGADVNARSDGYLLVPLIRAARGGHKEVVELLLANNADVNAMGDSATALNYAAEKGYSEIVELLLAKGADVNLTTFAGWTPLMYAVEEGHKEIVELLIKSGADVNVKNNAGQTALDIAIDKEHKEITQLLVDKGAVVSSIHVAAQMGDQRQTKQTNKLTATY